MGPLTIGSLIVAGFFVSSGLFCICKRNHWCCFRKRSHDPMLFMPNDNSNEILYTSPFDDMMN